MESEEIAVLKLRVDGVVQGVGYRAFAAAEARALALRGWVRNRSDSTVEALVAGPAKSVESFVAACARGPAGAQVTNLELRPSKPPDERGFHILPTL